MLKKLVYLTLLLILTSSWVYAFDTEQTHEILTERAVENTETLDNVLKTQLSFPKGFSEELSNGQHIYSIIKWLKEGSKEEDIPMCRAVSHFHDPLKAWNESMLTDPIWIVDIWCAATSTFRVKYSNVSWATGFVDPALTPLAPPVNNVFAPDSKENGRNWTVARKLFYDALTETDPQQREAFFAETFRTIGYILHLLEDMAVPAHTRNDFSEGHSRIIGCPKQGDCSWFGLDWVARDLPGHYM